MEEKVSMEGNMFAHIYQARSSSFGTSYEKEMKDIREEVISCIEKDSCPTAPRFIMFKVIDRCNSGCIYCGYAKQNHPETHFQSPLALDTENLISVFDQAEQLGVDAIALNGGEPLLRKDVVELTEALCQRRILPILMTNGVLLENKWDALGNAGLKYIIISLDSLVPEHYEFQRGINFTSAMRGVETALKMREKYGDVIIHLTTVLTRYNLEDMIPLVEFCDNNKIWLEISVYDTYGMTEDKLSVTDSLRLKQVVEKLKELKQCGSYISSSYEYLDHLEEFCIKHNRIPQNYSCFSGYGILLMDDTLNARPCWGSQVGNIGNIKECTLAEVWNNTLMQHYRKEMLCGRCGGCWNLCTEFNSMIRKA